MTKKGVMEALANEQERVAKTLEERTRRITMADLVPTRIPNLDLDELRETAAYKLPDTDEYLLVECEPARRKTLCPVCKESGFLTGDGYSEYPRLIHDIHLGNVSVDLSVKVPMYECKNCGAKSSHEFESILPKRQFTKRLYEYIKVESFHDDFESVAVRCGIDPGTVAAIFDAYVAELEENRSDVEVSSWLAIDEKHIDHKMRGVFVDGMTGRLLEMTQDNKPDTIRETIKSFWGYEDIHVVTMDMSNGYRAVVEDIFGSNAKVVVDKWHVLNDLSTKITKCKTAIMEDLSRQIQNEADPDVRARKNDVKKQVASVPYLFKFGTEKLTEKPYRIQVMGEACKTFPELNHLRLLKETFELIYDCSDRAAADAMIDEWSKLVPPSGKLQRQKWEAEYGVNAELFDEMRPLLNTVSKNWRNEILNYFDCGLDRNVTNAVAESINAFIDRFSSKGYIFPRLRAKCLYWHQVGARTRYMMGIRKKAVASPDFTMSDPRQMGFYIPHKDKSVYEEIYGIVHEEIPNTEPPLSVYSFLPPEAFSNIQDLLFGYVRDFHELPV